MCDLPVLSGSRVVDESPQWLAAKGRLEQAQAIVAKMRRRNRIAHADSTDSSSDFIKTDNTSSVDEKPPVDTWSMVFRSRQLLLNFSINCFIW